MKLTARKDYKEERRKVYMDVGDQLDAILEVVKKLKENGMALPEKTERWILHCNEIKTSISK
ncbi:MAG: hypothetical protein ACRDCA_28115 [Serratia sp. (in: enterobacteria)]|uniref:hypothetical protein n=1 Tax=Serratia sp. (in: enterobacteria) TaxID=616 RepID=UPI003F3315F0